MGGKLNSDPEALVGVNLFQAVFHKLSDDRGTEAEEENSCVRPHSYHGMVVTEAYHRIWFGLRDLCRWFIKILFMVVMILSQEETYLILIIEVRASMRLWLMLAVRECERDRVCVFLRILVNVFPFRPLESLKTCMIYNWFIYIYMYRAAIVRDRYALVVAPLCQETSASSYKFFFHPTEIVVAHLIVTELKTASVSFGLRVKGTLDTMNGIAKELLFFLPLFKSQICFHHVSKVCFRSNAGGRPAEGHICSCTTHARLDVHSAQVTDLQLTKIWSG